jgi:hypothetical protein
MERSTLIPQTEREQIERWRFEELVRSGYSIEAAENLSTSHEVDLHRAVDMILRGCDEALALRILL